MRNMAVEKPNIVREKSFDFAIKIIHFCRILKNMREFVLCDQLLGAGTSVGANIEEATQAQSRPDFVSKMSIALKEAYESRYWLRLILHGKVVVHAEVDVLLKDIDEIIRILAKILKTTKAS